MYSATQTNGAEMNTDSEQVQLLQLQIDALSRAVLHISSEVLKVGMAEHNPEHSEMIAVGAWGINLLTNGLGYELAAIKDWDQDDE